MIFIQVHIEDKAGYISDYDDFNLDMDAQYYRNKYRRTIGEYIDDIIKDKENFKIVIKKYER